MEIINFKFVGDQYQHPNSSINDIDNNDIDNNDFLLPCPFCGSKAYICTKPKDQYEQKHTYYIECEKGDCFSGTYTIEEKAIQSWNNRIFKN
jgi:Lar family restriction alleviation protein